MKPAWTDAPIYELGDSTKPQGGVFPTFPVRKCKLLSYRGHKYVKVEVDGVISWVKAYCLYSKKGRYGEVRPVSWRRLRKLCAITKRGRK